MLCIKGWGSGNLEMLRIWTIFQKEMFKTLFVSISLLNNSPFSDKFIFYLCVNLLNSKGLSVFQKRLLSVTFFSSELEQDISLAFH